jgi:hypothetical protein
VGPPEVGRAARDDDAPAPSAGHPSATPPSSLTMSAPAEASGADAGRLTHWSQPGGGTSSSGISTTAAWLSSIGAGAGGTDGAMTTVVMTADGAATTCCDSAAAATLREPSLAVVAVLPAARGALDELRLVGTAASDLNTLAGARGGTVGATLRTQRREIRHPPLKDMASGGAIAYLRVEKPRFLFLGGSAGVVAAVDVATAATPVASAARAGTSAARVASLVGCLVADAPTPAPGAVSSAASAALGEGAQAPTSRGEVAPHRPPPPPCPTTSIPKSPGRRAPAARAAKTPHSSVPGALAAGFSSPSCASPALAPAAVLRACVLRLGACVGRIARRPRSPAAGDG